MRLRVFLVVFVAVVSSSAFADPGWVLTTADFKQQPVSLEGVDGKGVSVTPVGATGAKTVPLAEFLEVARASGSRQGTARFALHLVNGDRVLGEPAGYVNEQIVWNNSSVGELKVSLKDTRALVRSGKAVPGIEQARTEDMVQLANGDSAKGIVTDLGGGKVKINSNGADIELPLESVDWIHFASAARPPAEEQVEFRLRLSDGSTLTVRSVQVTGADVSFAVSAQDTRKVPLSGVSAIEQLNGPVSWLSSRRPEQVVQLPYYKDPLTRAWPTRMDASVLDGRDGTPLPIRFAGRTYARGIGVHSYSRIDFPLDGRYKAFRTQYAISPDENPRAADVTVRVKLDGKTVHEKEHVKADQLSPVVLLDLPADAKVLTLEVDYGAGQHWQDRFNWIEPALLREKPKPEPEPAPATQPSTQPATRPSTQPYGIIPSTQPGTQPVAR